MVIDSLDFSSEINKEDFWWWTESKIIRAIYPKNYQDLLATAESLGYKEGWAYYKAKSVGWNTPKPYSVIRREVSHSKPKHCPRRTYYDDSDMPIHSYEESLLYD